MVSRMQMRRVHRCAIFSLLDRENKAKKVCGNSIYILLDNSSSVLTLKKVSLKVSLGN